MSNIGRIELKSRVAARRILQVGNDASAQEIRKAYRAASVKYHPDKNNYDPQAAKKFMLVQCAYELLMHGKPCPELQEKQYKFHNLLPESIYRLDNEWGYFLFWRDTFF